MTSIPVYVIKWCSVRKGVLYRAAVLLDAYSVLIPLTLSDMD